MSKEQLIGTEILDETKTEANVEVVHKIKDAKSNEGSTKEPKTGSPKAEKTTKKAETKQTSTTEVAIEEETKSTQMNLLLNDGSPDHDALKTYVTGKSRPHFVNKQEDEKFMFRVNSEDLLSTTEIKPVIDHDIFEEIEQNIIEESRSLQSFESLESLESNISYILQNEIEFRPDFFDVLGEIPDISEISFDLSFARSRMSIRSSKPVESEYVLDIGKFVNPLTGEVEPTPESEETVEELKVDIEVGEVEEDEDESETERWDVEDEDLLILLETDQEVPIQKRVSIDKVFETFLQMETIREETAVQDVDYAAKEREAIKKQILVITFDFISQLIRKVVETCEYIDPSIILRHNLDKIKLMENIESKLAELDVEQRARIFLNRKTVDYFKRKKAFRSILDDNPDTIAKDIQKFKEAIAKLDYMMGKENDLKSATTVKITTLNTEVASKEEEDRKQITAFEDMVKKSLHQDKFGKLPQVVINLLSRIDQLRNEVSEVRLILLQRQHTFASLVEKLDKLENLGNDLCMTDFEHLQTQTQALGKKIEERNSELNKLRIRCNAELHIMSHMKEKQKMLRSSISIQQMALDDLQYQKKYIRERLFHLKVSRGRIRKEIHDLSFQCGILDKPALMFDYDDTVDRLKILHSKIVQYKHKYSELQQKIQKLERKCE